MILSNQTINSQLNHPTIQENLQAEENALPNIQALQNSQKQSSPNDESKLSNPQSPQNRTSKETENSGSFYQSFFPKLNFEQAFDMNPKSYSIGSDKEMNLRNSSEEYQVKFDNASQSEKDFIMKLCKDGQYKSIHPSGRFSNSFRKHSLNLRRLKNNISKQNALNQSVNLRQFKQPINQLKQQQLKLHKSERRMTISTNLKFKNRQKIQQKLAKNTPKNRKMSLQNY